MCYMSDLNIAENGTNQVKKLNFDCFGYFGMRFKKCVGLGVCDCIIIVIA